MSLPISSLNLLNDFPPSTNEEWRAAAEKLLKGAAFDEKMTTPLDEGITIHPIYTRESDDSTDRARDAYPGFGTLRRGATAEGQCGRGWRVAQEAPNSSPEDLNATLRSELDRGLDAVHIVLHHAAGSVSSADPHLPGQGGVSLQTLLDLETILEGIDLERIPLMVQAGASALPMLAFLVAIANRRGFHFSSIVGSVVADPLGTLVRTGSLPAAVDHFYDDMYLSVEWADSVMSGLRVVGVDGSCYHDGGASAVDELGFVLAAGAEYLREMVRRGCPVDRVGKRFLFQFSVGPNFFLEIAKLRAARVLWSSIVAAFDGGLDARRMHIHACTSAFYATRYDPYVNLLRSTTEALSAVLGGSESLHVSSFDECFKTPDEFSRRIARNTQIVLLEEAHVNHVADPAGGSWYVEWLTDAIAEQSWKTFQAIESAGGMARALSKGIPQQIVAGRFEHRMEEVAENRIRVVGVNAYPNREEKPLADTNKAAADDSYQSPSPSTRFVEKPNSISELDTIGRENPVVVMEALVYAASAGATRDELLNGLHPPTVTPMTVLPIPPRRLAEAYEHSRMTGEGRGPATEVQP